MTTEIVKFFVPGEHPDPDAAYAELAGLCGRAVPPRERRVREIEWVHDGDNWTAVVGQPLKGSRTRTVRRKGQKVEQTVSLSDPAEVLAIFEGIPFKVVTDARPITDRRSAWANPFFAGKPRRVRYFES